VVCPSLDLVAVRLGVGSNKSRLPGDNDDSNWGKRVAGFFHLVTDSVNGNAPASSAKLSASAAPYPPSPVFKSISWAPVETIVRQAKDSDNWPITWGDDDHLYTAYGDGTGFEPKVPEKLSLGFAKVSGAPPDVVGVNIRSPTGELKGPGASGGKASGLLMVEGVLYLWVRNLGNARLAWSADHARSWEWSDWKFTTGFGCPTFDNKYGNVCHIWPVALFTWIRLT